LRHRSFRVMEQSNKMRRLGISCSALTIETSMPQSVRCSRGAAVDRTQCRTGTPGWPLSLWAPEARSACKSHGRNRSYAPAATPAPRPTTPRAKATAALDLPCLFYDKAWTLGNWIPEGFLGGPRCLRPAPPCRRDRRLHHRQQYCLAWGRTERSHASSYCFCGASTVLAPSQFFYASAWTRGGSSTSPPPAPPRGSAARPRRRT
jgi:hypothetical protein